MIKSKKKNQHLTKLLNIQWMMMVYLQVHSRTLKVLKKLTMS